MASNKLVKLKERKIAYKAMLGKIADMESDGVYFDESTKEVMRKQREALYCEYSGLPSVMSYQD